MNIVNLTPHPVNLPGLTIPASGRVARSKEFTCALGSVDGIDIINRWYGETVDLPEPEPDTLFIVSMIVREANPDRLDLASPGDPVRDYAGEVIGAKNLVVNPIRGTTPASAAPWNVLTCQQTDKT